MSEGRWRSARWWDASTEWASTRKAKLKPSSQVVYLVGAGVLTIAASSCTIGGLAAMARSFEMGVWGAMGAGALMGLGFNLYYWAWRWFQKGNASNG